MKPNTKSTNIVVKNRTVLITGGTSGIGYALVKKLAPINNETIVVASNKIKLEQLREEFSHLQTYCCSLDNSVALVNTFTEIINNHPNISLVINNAGIQETPTFLDKNFNIHRIENEISINLAAPIKICALMLPSLLELAEPSAFVNVTSGLALFPKKNSAVYCATKAGLRNFTQSFRYQLEDSNIKVYEAIMPLVDTPMTTGRGRGKISAERAATAIIEGIEHNQEEIYIGKTKLIPWIARFSPRLMAAIMKAS